jgi:anti-anti-sigma factor
VEARNHAGSSNRGPGRRAPDPPRSDLRGWRLVPGTPERRRVRRPFASHLHTLSSRAPIDLGIADDLAIASQVGDAGNGRTVRLRGEITREATGALEAVAALTPAPDTVVVLDLTEVSFVDLHGARRLLQLYDRLRLRGARVVLNEPSETLLRVFEVLEVEPPVEVTWR